MALTLRFGAAEHNNTHARRKEKKSEVDFKKVKQKKKHFSNFFLAAAFLSHLFFCLGKSPSVTIRRTQPEEGKKQNCCFLNTLCHCVAPCEGVESSSDVALYSGLAAGVVTVVLLVVAVTLYRKSQSEYGVDVIDSSALTGGFQSFSFKSSRQGEPPLGRGTQSLLAAISRSLKRS